MVPADPTSTGLNVLMISLAVLIVFYNVFAGWRNGVVRQICRVIALVAAYLLGMVLGPLLAPLLTPLQVPAGMVKIAACLLAGLAVYIILTLLTNVLFRKTQEQGSASMRWLYGVGGAAIGLVFSAIALLAALSGIRMLGTVAEAQITVARTHPEQMAGKNRVWRTEVARAKDTLENGPAGPALKAADPTPEPVYEFLKKISLVSANPDAMGRFMNFPGTRQLMAHPALQRLAQDPEIQQTIQARNFAALLQNPKIIALYQDQTLLPLVQKFELQRALDYSLAPGVPVPSPTPALPAVERY